MADSPSRKKKRIEFNIDTYQVYYTVVPVAWCDLTFMDFACGIIPKQRVDSARVNARFYRHHRTFRMLRCSLDDDCASVEIRRVQRIARDFRERKVTGALCKNSIKDFSSR